MHSRLDRSARLRILGKPLNLNPERLSVYRKNVTGRDGDRVQGCRRPIAEGRDDPGVLGVSDRYPSE